MAVNLAEKYSSKVAERFKQKSLSAAFTNSDYEWNGVKTLTVYSIDTVELNDYTRSGTSRYGTPSELGDTKQEMSVSQDKAFTFTIDKGNNADQMNVKGAGKALAREIDEVIVPTEDKYVFGKIAAAAKANDNSATAAVTKTNAYEAFLNGQEKLDDASVPTEGRVAAVTSGFLKYLKLSDDFVRASELGQKMLVTGQVGEIDGTKIVKVPRNRMPENCEFIITHPSVTVKAEKLDDYKIHQDPPGINGNLVEGRVYYDAFVLDAKKDGIYVSKKA
jgi:N4-gp56 family major capsid protein